MTVNRQDFCEEVCWVDEARKEDKTEKILTGPFLGLGLLRSNRGSRKTNRAFVVDE